MGRSATLIAAIKRLRAWLPKVRWPSAVALTIAGVVGLGVRNQLVAPLLAIHIAGMEVFGLTLWPLHLLLACALGLVLNRPLAWALVGWLAVWAGLALVLLSSPGPVSWAGLFHPAYRAGWLGLLAYCAVTLGSGLAGPHPSWAMNPLAALPWYARVGLGTTILVVAGAFLAAVGASPSTARGSVVYGLGGRVWLVLLGELWLMIGIGVCFSTRPGWTICYAYVALMAVSILGLQGGFDLSERSVAPPLLIAGPVAATLIVAVWMVTAVTAGYRVRRAGGGWRRP